MMTFFRGFFFFILSLILLVSCSDDLPEEELPVCETDRYSVDMFTSFEKTTLKFGENINQEGQLIELYMDVYTPENDNLDKRPAIVWAFGGAFITGERQDMEEFALDYVRKGYVCATFDYRLISFNGNIPDSSQATDIAVKAMQDMKAAIRELKKDAATDNRFRVDPDLIFAAGVSAGAITALQAGIFDESDLEDDEAVKNAILANGGIKGNSGDAENQSFDSKVAGVINLSGAVFNLAFFDSTDPPIISYHGDADIVVKYGYDFAEVFFQKIIKLYGSGAFHPYLDQIGIRNLLFTVPGGGHVDIYRDAAFANDLSMFSDQAITFIRDEICM